MTPATTSLLGAGIGAGASLLGSGINAILGGSAQKQQAELFQRNYDAQKEFAQNSIQWRVADARNAGLHPLAVLGQMGSHYTPTTPYEAGVDYGSGIAQAGAQVSQAMGQISLMQAEADLESKRLENATKLIDLENKSAQSNMAQMSNALAGLKNDILSEVKKAEVQTTHDHNPYTGMYNGVQGVSPQMMENMSENFLGSLILLPQYFGAAIDAYTPHPEIVQDSIDSRYPALKGLYDVKHKRDWFGNISYDIIPTERLKSSPRSKELQKLLEKVQKEFKRR